MGAIVDAASNQSPLVITAGQQVRPILAIESMLSSPRATELPRPAVKFSAEPARPQDVPGLLARAIHVAMTPPWGLVFVSVPTDDWAAPATDRATDLALARRVETRAAPGPVALDQIAQVLGVARAPALVIGGGVDAADAWDGAVALVERTAAAVHAPPGDGRAGFPQDHQQFRGALPMVIAPLAAALEGYDVVVVIGAPVFRYYPYAPGRFLPAGTRLVHITSSSDEAARAAMGHALVGGPGLTLRALVERVPRSSRPTSPRPAPPPS